MASSAAATQPCHLERLPNELIFEILGLVVEGADQVQRRKVLLPLCRLSKHFGGLAQRTLWRHVRLHARRSRLRVLDDDPLLEVVVTMTDLAWAPSVVKTPDIKDYDGKEPNHLDLFAMTLPGVHHLDLANLGDVNLTHTAFFHELRQLALDKMSPFLSARRAPLVLPKLETLSIRNIDLDTYPECALFFTSATLPALRHLSIRACASTSRLDPQPQFPCLPSAFIGQLDDLQLDLEDQGALSEDDFPSTGDVAWNRSILFHSDTLLAAADPPPVTSFLPVQHLQIDHQGWIRDGPARLSRLYSLPALRLVLVPTWPTVMPCDRAAYYTNVCVNHCVIALKLRGIELRLFDPSAPLKDGQLVVPEFVDYLRETAAAAAAQ
ncbi:hypothetical protein JCM3775_006322 [Rhodotorula graminis]